MLHCRACGWGSFFIFTVGSPDSDCVCRIVDGLAVQHARVCSVLVFVLGFAPTVLFDVHQNLLCVNNNNNNNNNNNKVDLYTVLKSKNSH